VLTDITVWAIRVDRGIKFLGNRFVWYPSMCNSPKGAEWYDNYHEAEQVCATELAKLKTEIYRIDAKITKMPKA
jgi:hypothetical protein